FSPNPPIDQRPRVLQEIARRQGQPKFRENLLSAYAETCAVTGCKEISVLEAAHIDRYLGVDSHHISNGLLLRADIHVLFDQHLLKVNPTTMQIEVSEDIDDLTYRQLHGHPLKKPVEERLWPSAAALR